MLSTEHIVCHFVLLISRDLSFRAVASDTATFVIGFCVDVVISFVHHSQGILSHSKHRLYYIFPAFLFSVVQFFSVLCHLCF